MTKKVVGCMQRVEAKIPGVRIAVKEEGERHNNSCGCAQGLGEGIAQRESRSGTYGTSSDLERIDRCNEVLAIER